MGSRKNVQIAESDHDRLWAMKRKGESYGDVVDRLLDYFEEGENVDLQERVENGDEPGSGTVEEAVAAGCSG